MDVKTIEITPRLRPRQPKYLPHRCGRTISASILIQDGFINIPKMLKNTTGIIKASGLLVGSNMIQTIINNNTVCKKINKETTDLRDPILTVASALNVWISEEKILLQETISPTCQALPPNKRRNGVKKSCIRPDIQHRKTPIQ